MSDRLTIFLSHSHKDLEKVRKLREILESLDYEPLIFFLKCLDDSNEELEDFIKRAINFGINNRCFYNRIIGRKRNYDFVGGNEDLAAYPIESGRNRPD